MNAIGHMRGARRHGAAWAVAACLALAAGPAAAGPLTGSSVSASFISGAGFWNILPTAPQPIPTSYSLGLSGFPALAMSIDADGLVSLTPHPQSCGAGCGYAMGGATFEFSFDAGSLALTGLTLVDSAPGLAITATWMDADSFRISVGDGGGVAE